MGIVNKKLHIGSYEIFFSSPDWAKGLDCIDSCGYCCITEIPTNVPKKFDPRLQVDICGHYNSSKKICLNYDNRPSMCRLYPLILGVENKILKFSAMLGCPSTNTNKFNINLIKEALEEKENDDRIENLRHNSRQASKMPYWNHVKNFYKIVKNDLINFSSMIVSFPILKKVWSLLNNDLNTFLHLPDTPLPQIPTIRELLEKDIRESGVYIATRFSRFDCINLSLKGNKVRMRWFDGRKKKFSLLHRKLPLTSEAS